MNYLHHLVEARGKCQEILSSGSSRRSLSGYPPSMTLARILLDLCARGGNPALDMDAPDGWVRRQTVRSDSQLQGLASWAMGTLAVVVLLASACGGASTGPKDSGTDSRPGDCCVVLPCTSNCDVVGESTCDLATGARWVCTEIRPQCLVRVQQSCPTDSVCLEGRCVSCEGTVGTFRDQPFPFESEDRRYYLHVPDDYSCTEPWPLLVDLHGTASPPWPEEAYGLDGARDTADASGYVLLRPRSRSSMEGGAEIFRWDQNVGDPETNRRFVNALVEDLGQRYNIDPQRRYIMGFSSGTNQTAMSLADSDSPFSGYGFVGGGSWTVPDVPLRPARLYFNTGYRDYMRLMHDELLLLLEDAGYAGSDMFFRETDAGHELYDWMYPELFAFLDRGLRPAAGDLASGWSEEISNTGEALLALSILPSGELLAVGSEGVLVRRDTGGVWEPVVVSGLPAFQGRDLTAVCVTGDGTGIAVGGGLVVRSQDGGQTWSHRPAVPDLGDPLFGFSYLNGVACGPVDIVAIGYWSGAVSHDGGLTFGDLTFDNLGYRAQGAAIETLDGSTWLAVGYWGYVARASVDLTFATASLVPHADWVNDVAPVTLGVWIAVGEAGNIWRSTDDGLSFQGVSAAGPDLYAVSFLDAQTGLAVGRHGAALLTQDGGLTWVDVSTGLDLFCGDVQWLMDGTAVVVGEAGLALRFDPSAL